MPDGRPRGKFVHSGLTQEDALAVASDYAEDEGLALARHSARWRTAAPSDKQLRFAQSLGITDANMMTRGVLSDELSVRSAGPILAYFANWSRQWNTV